MRVSSSRFFVCLFLVEIEHFQYVCVCVCDYNTYDKHITCASPEKYRVQEERSRRVFLFVCCFFVSFFLFSILVLLFRLSFIPSFLSSFLPPPSLLLPSFLPSLPPFFLPSFLPSFPLPSFLPTFLVGSDVIQAVRLELSSVKLIHFIGFLLTNKNLTYLCHIDKNTY